MKKHLYKILIFITLSLIVIFSSAQGAYRDNLSEFTKLEYDYYRYQGE